MTTQRAFFFPQKARALHAAGLRRVSFSLRFACARTISGRSRAATASTRFAEHRPRRRELGLHPVKVNAVIIRGLNDHEIEALAGFASRAQPELRFIEFMPLDSARAWLKEDGRACRSCARLQGPVRPAADSFRKSLLDCPALAFPDGRGEVGIIAPGQRALLRPLQSHPADCGRQDPHLSIQRQRARPCARTCARGTSDEEIATWLKGVVWQKEDRHHIGEPDFQAARRAPLSCIGG